VLVGPYSKRIFTLGTSNRSEEDFIEIILFYGINVVADVRSFPRSKIPTFTQEYLADLLRREGMKYSFLGRELGGLRKGGYKSYAETDAFRIGIDKLEEITAVGTGVIICAERFPWKCHRRWIARELHRRGWTIEHIIDKGKVWIPR
jgi:uncharacterized protein (DUF488 family)